MWDLLTHIFIGIFIGWYLFPFQDGHTIRNKVNTMVKNLFASIIATMKDNKKTEKTTRKRTTAKEPKQDNVVFPKGKVCSTCKSTYLIPLSGEMKGFGLCPQCQKMETAR